MTSADVVSLSDRNILIRTCTRTSFDNGRICASRIIVTIKDADAPYLWRRFHAPNLGEAVLVVAAARESRPKPDLKLVPTTG